MRRRARGDRGNVLVVSAITLTVLMAAASFVVDVGMLFSERRQDQSAADAGVLGGALDLPSGIDTASEQAAALVRTNLPTSYTDAEWATMWAACTDDEAFYFTGRVLGTATPCISFDGFGTFRVRVPEQAVPTAFARVLGIDAFSSSATAEASLTIPGVGGVLPFAVLGSAASGAELCLRTATGGQAAPPCDGPQAGNFGALEVPQWGPPASSTDGLPCNLNKSDQLLVNISVGIDHFIRSWTGSTVVDACNKPFGPNTLRAFQGVSGGLFEGMVTGDVVQGLGFQGRLARGANTKLGLQQGGTIYPIDNVPLWRYIPYGKGVTVPPTCTRESFELVAATLGYPAAETQMGGCLTTYAAGSYPPLFDIDADGDRVYDIVDNPRYGAVPQFIEGSFPNGNSGEMRIGSFRAVFINGLYFGCNGNGCSTIVTPGATTGTVSIPNGSSPLDQVTGYLLPNNALPAELLANGVLGALGAYQVTLSG